jgi:hypothetical protein
MRSRRRFLSGRQYRPAPVWRGAAGSAGVEERGMYTGGPPGTWEVSSSPSESRRLGVALEKGPGPPCERTRTEGERRMGRKGGTAE